MIAQTYNISELHRQRVLSLNMRHILSSLSVGFGHYIEFLTIDTVVIISRIRLCAKHEYGTCYSEASK